MHALMQPMEQPWGGAPDTGTFGGHLIGGTAFLIFGMALLVRAMIRILRSRAGGAGLDMRETSKSVLRSVGVMVVIATAFGMFISNAKHKTEEMRLVHVVVYFSWCTVGLTAIAESCGLLPVDAVRFSAGVAGGAEFLVFAPHVALHHMGTMQAYHLMLLVPMLVAFVAGFGAYAYPTSATWHLVLIVGVTMQGAWFDTMAYTFYGAPPGMGAWLHWSLSFQQVPALFALTLFCLIALLVVLFNVLRVCIGAPPAKFSAVRRADGDGDAHGHAEADAAEPDGVGGADHGV